MENNKNIKRIVVINKYDNKKKEWELNRVVFFMEDEAPILSNFDNEKENEAALLGNIANFIEASGFDIQNNGFKNAVSAGLINVISNLDKKSEATLNNEILKEQLKYGINPDKFTENKMVEAESKEENSTPNTKSLENEDDRKVELDIDDRALALYFKNLEHLKRKRILAAEGKLHSDDNDIDRCLKNMAKIAEYNARVAKLENARLELERNLISQEQYDKIYSEYKTILASSIKTASRQKQSNANVNSKRTESIELSQVQPQGNNVPPKVLPQYRSESISSNLVNSLDSLGNHSNVVAGIKHENLNQKENLYNSKEKNVINLPANMGTQNYNGNFTTRFVGKDDSNNNINVPPKVSEDYRIETIKPIQATVGDTKNSKEPVPEVQKPKQTEVTGISPKRRRQNNNFILNENTPSRDARGVKVSDGVQEEINIKQKAENSKNESNPPLSEVPPKKVKVTWTKKLLKFLVGGVGIVLSTLGITKLYDTIKNKKSQHVQSITNKSMSSVINNYCEKMNVPDKTKTFLNRVDVTNFLSQYKNSDQLNEVISAICFGYEANILTSENGNFKLYEDGNNTLRMFTNDFLCAKAVINGYTPSQLLSVFGGTNISAEEVMKGFRNFYLTNMTYCTSAEKSLPYRYLTNGNTASTEAFENLFSKLANVNEQRKAGTLTSRDTDAFIVAVHEFYTQSNNSGKNSEADRIFAASFVDAFAHVQANIAGGEPLYLHKDYGYAKAGINLSEVSGGFVGAKDKTTYEFNSLYDIINAKYGMIGEYGSNCKGLQDTLEDNLYKMNLIASGSKEQSALTLANALYRNGLDKYAERVTKGNINQSLLDEIENVNPALADEIDEYQRSVSTAKANYVPFDITTDGVDKLLGIKGLTNSNTIPKLINIRRELAFNYDNYKVLDGKWYTNGYGRDGKYYNKTVTVTTTRQEKVDYDSLSATEKKEADSKRQELERTEEERLQEEKNNAEKVAQRIVDQIESGNLNSQEEAQKIADSVGMKLEENVVDTIKELHEKPGLEEQREAERAQKTEEEASKKHQAEADAQAEAALKQAELINKSLELEGGSPSVPENPGTPSGGDDQTDSDRVDNSAGEEPYVVNDTVSSLQSLKAAALAAADMVQDVNTNDSSKVLSLNA